MKRFVAIAALALGIAAIFYLQPDDVVITEDDPGQHAAIPLDPAPKGGGGGGTVYSSSGTSAVACLVAIPLSASTTTAVYTPCSTNATAGTWTTTIASTTAGASE